MAGGGWGKTKKQFTSSYKAMTEEVDIGTVAKVDGVVASGHISPTCEPYSGVTQPPGAGVGACTGGGVGGGDAGDCAR